MPEGWLTTTLGTIAEVVGGGTPSTSVEKFWGGDVPWITPTEITAQEGTVIASTNRSITADGLANSGAKLLPRGAVLLTSRATIGAVALAGCPMATNQGFASLVAGPMALPRFLMYWCQWSKQEFVARAGGNTFLEISKGKVRDVPIDLPPLAEQRRIADLILGLDSVVAAITREIQALQGLSEALFAHHCEDVAHEPTFTISDLCVSVVGGVWGKPLGEGEIDVLALGPRIFSQGSPTFSTVGSPLRSVTRAQFESRLVRPDDIILERSGGSPDQPVGRVVYASKELDPCIPTDFMRLLRTNEHLVAARYLFWRLRADYVAGETRPFQRQTTGINNLAVPAYLARAIPIPTRAVQDVFTDCCDTVAAALAEATGCLREYAALRASLVSELFSGSMRLPDSYDPLLEAS